MVKFTDKVTQEVPVCRVRIRIGALGYVYVEFLPLHIGEYHETTQLWQFHSMHTSQEDARLIADEIADCGMVRTEEYATNERVVTHDV